MNFNGSLFAISDAPKMVAVVLVIDDGDDQKIVNTIYTSQMAAEKVAKMLDIEMIPQDEINDDVYVFPLKSEEQLKLTMKMFDEEGYEVASNRAISDNSGNNYNDLKVKKTKEGSYKLYY